MVKIDPALEKFGTTWTTNDGTVLLISEMSFSHRDNAMNLMMNRLSSAWATENNALSQQAQNREEVYRACLQMYSQFRLMAELNGQYIPTRIKEEGFAFEEDWFA